MDGVILIDKPQGKTSHHVVQIIKKKLGAQKVGHAGTLDPLATGLLVILINKATKLSDLFLNKDKVYEVAVQLFVETNTDDITGEIIKEEKIKNIELNQIHQTIAFFNNNEYWQKPPLYSAIKLKGKKLYQYARQGLKVEIPARLVKINHLELLDYIPKQGIMKLLVNCSKGTYIRSLAKDIAKKLKTIATVSQLRRISSGNFHLQEAIFLEEVSPEKVISLEKIGMINYKLMAILKD
ncbi:tRNA pseudouridine(55) synthase TruB [endosymbiont GvMRE of Glomus versiforme]|uniref:tRNA pseudouridine(55) synthase TruB n=1 Tax=endosymbiont GvMRE of Glomus versiforme TaxID=2039283 RepID=UPI000EDA6C1D|nr:tRNA pseudouridine(55) synthase TruB [endosymbiont GvMRE of Glomus versiforme]RHZ37039.1 tRNA pseudouridine synthase B [endosymbiont GvMRE of Glomus versiforme]